MDEPKQQCERLLNALLPFAGQMLAESGQFEPYGGFISDAGDLYHVGVRSGPSSPAALAALRTSFRRIAMQQNCTVVGIVSDIVTNIPELDWLCEAIHFSLDHSTGYSVEVFMPYQIVEREVVFGEVFAHAGKHNLFQ